MRKAFGLMLLLAGLASADVFDMPGGQTSLEFVKVGNPGNAPDTRFGMPGNGAVGSVYSVGKFEVTAAQYCEFLNAVADTDTYGLYSTLMDVSNSAQGCNIKQTGTAGSYTYSVPDDWADRPVNYIGWGDAARFANWLTNGQPTGPQGPQTTEDGSYSLNGATTNAALLAVRRKPDARYALPSQDEWYKAAYYDPQKAGGPGYWSYPTRTNATPSNAFSAAGTNNANFYVPGGANGGFTLGTVYWRNEAGAFEASRSAYGTYDQGGNVAERHEGVLGNGSGIRGGSFNTTDSQLHAAFSSYGNPVDQGPAVGFRIVAVDASDLNHDGRLGVDDFLIFSACATGAGVPYSPASLPPGCTLEALAGRIEADFDADGDVDMDDFGVFQR